MRGALWATQYQMTDHEMTVEPQERASDDAVVVDQNARACPSSASTDHEIVRALVEGEIEEKGLLPYSSNYAFLITVHHRRQEIPSVYKPRRGENPLWDFPAGTLCQRETAAFVVSEALGWGVVPPTVLRDGPRGPGSIQFFIDCDPDIHYFNMREDARYAPALRRLTLFDYLINNADRKAGHCLYGYDERMWAIDHGICFHHQYKLRTVIWEFAGEPIEEELLANLESFATSLKQVASPVHRTLNHLLSPPEQQALCHRVKQLEQTRQYPLPPAHQRNYPWPPI